LLMVSRATSMRAQLRTAQREGTSTSFETHFTSRLALDKP
jgi:hypothetical protein